MNRTRRTLVDRRRSTLANRAGLIVALALALPLAGCGGPPDGGGARAAEGAEAPIPVAVGVTARRLWIGEAPNFYASGPAPDGRSVTEIDWSTGDLAVRELEGAALRRVTDKGEWSVSDEYAEGSVFSPDGRWIAYAWAADAYELRVIGTDGTGERTLIAGSPEIEYVHPEDWSADGRWILGTLFRSDGMNQIVLVSAETGAVTVLKTVGWRYPAVAAFSPDGRTIAYDLPEDAERTETSGERHRDIFLLAADGSRETRVVSGPGNDRLAGWLPGGGGLLFHSDRGGAPAIWALPLRGMDAAGPPLLVKSDVWRFWPLGLAGSRYLYGVTVEEPQVHVATIDPEGGYVLVAPAPVADAAEGASRVPAWSPDGGSLAYVRNPAGGRSVRVVIRSAVGDESREVPVPMDELRDLHWLPDGRALLGGGRAEGRAGLYRFDLASGKVTLERPSTPELATVGGPRFLAADGRTFYRRRRDAEGHGALVAHDILTGELRDIVAVHYGGGQALSPDGRFLAFTDYDRATRLHTLRVVAAQGGESRVLHRVPVPDALTIAGGLNWTPDGRHILFVQWREERGTRGLWAIAAEGGTPRLLLEDDVLLWVRLHPDGRRIAFESGRSIGEVWALEGLDAVASALTAAR